ncbi:MAG: PHP domain-containing protein [Chloroflexota bacterium]|nr:PHP domain-containing protein [Chloroflexota bacterium]
MYLDLHAHSVSSDDSRATVEQYVKWTSVLRRKGRKINGFVLTEHRGFDFGKDYRKLGTDNDVLILKGSELDTNIGHVLVYGVTEQLADLVDFSEVGLDALNLIEAAEKCGAIVIPAHPGRFGVGLYEYYDKGYDLGSITIVEHLNGSNRPGEQERAEELIAKYKYACTGGSDAHLVSAIGTCMTEFDTTISNESELVQQLKTGDFKAVRIEQT